MKKLASLAIALIASLGAFAQPEAGTFTIAPTVAFNVADITGKVNDVKYDNDLGDCTSGARAGFAVGVDAGYQVSKRFGLTAGLFYSLQGTMRDSSIEIAEYKLSDKSNLNMSYLKVPILANVYLFKGFAIKAGIQPGFLLAAKSKTTVNSSVSGETKTTTDLKSEFNTIDFSIPVGVSYEFTNGLTIGARYEIGLTDVIKSDSQIAKAGINGKNAVFQISLGYKIKL